MKSHSIVPKEPSGLAGATRALTKELARLSQFDQFTLTTLNCLTAMLTDFCLSDKEVSMDTAYLIQRATSEGFSFFSKTLPILGKALDQGLATGLFHCPTSFRSWKGSALPSFLRFAFRQIFSNDGVLLSKSSPIAIQFVRQVCYFAYKADFPYTERQSSDVVERFVKTEEELALMQIPEDPLLEFASIVTRAMFSDFSHEKIVGNHGPGVTANVPLHAKWDHKLTAGLPSVSHFGETFFFNWDDSLTRLDRYPVYQHQDYFTSSNTARVILVNKDARGPRLISCEPAENQWVQQGIKDWIVRRLESHDFTAKHVNFSDQTINQSKARKGSLMKYWATLDLKDASDRVHCELVQRIFKSCSPLLSALFRTRSTSTLLPDGRRVLLRKFAPMGSALCFPVMAYCIWVILYSGLRGAGLSHEQSCSSIYVYGDDVIVPSKYAGYAMSLLERYGLKINREKSFVDSYFCESCGYDSFRGNEVTPIRLRKCFGLGKTKDPEVLVSLTATANLMNRLGYEQTSNCLYSYVESSCGPLPFGYPHSAFLCRWIPPTQDALWANIGRTSVRLQRYAGETQLAVKALTLTSIQKNTPMTGYGHLMRSWKLLGTDSPIPEIGTYQPPRRVALRRKWFPEIAFSRYSSAQ